MDWQDTVANMAADRAHGASELAVMALDLVAEQCAVGDEASLLALIESLITVRPSMAPLQNAMQAVLDAMDEDAFQIHEAVLGIRRQMKRDWAKTVSHVIEKLPEAGTILTVSLSSTVRSALLEGGERDLAVIVSESRPRYEGVSLARDLVAAGIKVTVITEAQLGLAAKEADLLLLGADTVLADGTAYNKVGSFLAALAAREAGVPCVVAADGWKWLPEDCPAPALEAMSGEELGHALPDACLRNTYFEPIPAGLIQAWITETGKHSA